MKKVVIAGANSFVASHFVHELLGQGFYVVALVRKSSDLSAAERMEKALEDTTLELPSQMENLKVLDYALNDVNFGISDADLAQIFEDAVDYFHFAASLKFDFRSREEIFHTNIDGIRNALQVFENFSSPHARFFYISTAYSCGKMEGSFEEKFYPDDDISSFRNYYEQSKRKAENVLRKFVEKNGISAHVIRLSQVVGNPQTGVTRTDYGIFDFARRIHALSDQFPGQSIRILVDPDANQNLIPINAVVQDLVSLTRKDQVPRILNFVANIPVENYKIIQTISDLLPIELIPEKEINPEEMNELEKMVLSGMTFTGDYINTDINFDTSMRDKVLNSNHREVNDSGLHAMLDYYLKNVRVHGNGSPKS